VGSRKKKKIRSRGWKKRELHNLEVVFAKNALEQSKWQLEEKYRAF